MKLKKIMVTSFSIVALVFAAASHADDSSQSGSATTMLSDGMAQAGKTSSMDLPADAQAASTTVDRFNKALQAGDMTTVEVLLDADVLILESGGAERNRQQYFDHHAAADAAFLKDAHVQLIHRTARRSGDLVWIGSESEIQTKKDGKPLTLLSTETMVLQRVGDEWRIVHIHWSSRPGS